MSIGDRYSPEQYEVAIDDMSGLSKYVEDFILSGTDFSALLVLFMSRGLPLRTRDHRDDNLIDLYDTQKESLREAFETFAHEIPDGRTESRVDDYIRFRMNQNLEHAA